MISESTAVATFSTDSIDDAIAFYGTTLGLQVLGPDTVGVEDAMVVRAAGGTAAFIYLKDDHVPATHTVLTLLVDDLDAVVAELGRAGVKPELLEWTDEQGIARGVEGMPPSAWVKDPAGNWVCFTEADMALAGGAAAA
ncbi:VOC family protein [Demequina capsici]|uniref:VOC family protein n=1 Tax=Demequina capsici TaxID=3075620 RepID=A0AA96FBH0_9MICO|nr:MULTISPECIES: VOC family protein [unclassified Demequina]WNM23480.1 VOC family protein [Demequina sp. OYTSA14]WNM26357.1 VOC family protein [Demequina sp. PMTSA13]